MRLARAALLILLAVTPAVAQRAQPTTPPDWRGTGLVMAVLPPPSSLHATRPVIVIQHEPIPGLMNEEMSHPFLAASVSLLRDLRAGDRVAFGLKDTPDALLIVTIERVATPRR